jgi:hypothetical protein
VGDGLGGERDVVLELDLLAGQVGLLDGFALLAGQSDGLMPHEQGNRAQRQDQRRDREEDDLLPELH